MVLRPGATVSAHDIIDFMRANLAHYKCPKSVDIVDALPRTPGGTVRRAALRERRANW